MAMHMVNEVTSLINDQIDVHEKIKGYLLKAEALAYVALSADFLINDHSLIYEYLGALHEIIFQSKEINECTLNDLSKDDRLNNNFE